MTTAIAKKQLTIADHLQDTSVIAKFAQVAPKTIGVERFTRIAMSEIMGNQKLKECTVPSLLSSLMQAVKLGLEPGILGQCYLVPFKEKGTPKCQLIVGYKGLVELSRRSGEIASIQARAVRRGDVFEFAFGMEPTLRHVPDANRTEFKDADITHFYAIVAMKDGAQQVEVMGKAQVDAIRARSRASSSGPWVTDYEAMGCKTVLKRALKLCPASVEVGEAIALDDRAEIGAAQPIHSEFIEQEEIEVPDDDRLADKLGAPKSAERTKLTAVDTDGDGDQEQQNAATDAANDHDEMAKAAYGMLREMGPSNRRNELTEKYGLPNAIRTEDLRKMKHNDLLDLNSELIGL